MPTAPVARITVEPGEVGLRLDILLAERFAVSRGRAQKLVEDARLNGSPAKASYTLRAGDVIELEIADAPLEGAPAEPDPGLDVWRIPILYEDDHLLVLVKPRGLVVHPGAGQERGTLVDWLRASGRTLSTVGPPERAGRSRGGGRSGSRSPRRSSSASSSA